MSYSSIFAAASKKASPSSIIKNGDLVAKATEYWNASDAIERYPPDKDYIPKVNLLSGGSGIR